VRSSSRRGTCAVLIAAGLAASGGSWAGESDSQSFFAQGRTLRAAGNCKDAITAFERALELFPQGLGALRNIAECEEKIGQYASARNSYWSLRRAVLQSNDPKYDGWEKFAEEGYNRLGARVAKLTVIVEGASPDATVHVTIDGKPLDPRLWGTALERDLGAHEVKAAYGGAEPIVERRTLVAGSDERVKLLIPRTATAPSASATATAVAAGGFPYKAAAITGFVVGAAGAIGMGISIGIHAGALAAVDRTCPTHSNCPDSLRADRDRGATAASLVNVLAITAAVGAGAGLTFFLLAPSSRSQTKAEIQVVPLAQGGALVARGRF